MKIIKKIIKKIKENSGNTLYYKGCMTRFVVKDIEENYKKILNYLKIDFLSLDDEFCCGSPLINAGYNQKFINQIQKVKKQLKEYNITKIITNCPSCYEIFHNIYPKYDPTWDIKTTHITEILNENIDKLKITKEEKETIAYHDPCHLGRYSNIYNEPRNIYKKIGIQINEFKDNHELSNCCGGGAGLSTNNKLLANKIAKNRINETKERKISTTCPMCYKHLKNNSEDKEITELSQEIIKRLDL